MKQGGIIINNAENIFARIREEYNESHDEQITQHMIAEKCNTSKSTISRLERGETKIPAPDVMKAYCDLFGVTMEYLSGYSSSKKIENMVVGHELHLTDEAVETIKLIKEASDSKCDYMEILNALISNKEYTLNFLQIIMEYFAVLSENQDNPNSNLQLSYTVFAMEIINYFQNIMKPQLNKAIGKYVEYKEELSSIPISAGIPIEDRGDENKSIENQ